MSTDVLGTSRDEVAREVLTEQFLALNDDLGNGAVRWATAIAAMLAFSDRERAPVQVEKAALFNVIHTALQDERDGEPCGCIVEKGCEAAGYCDPESAADAFKSAVADAIFTALTPSLQPGGEEEAALALAEEYAAKGDWNGAYHAMRAAFASPAPSALSVPEIEL